MNLSAKWFQRIVAELVGTTLFLFAVSASVVIPTAYLSSTPGIISIITALIQGLTLVAVVAIFSSISGSHFNPAITTVSIFTGKMAILLGLSYIIAQCIGAIIGSAIFRGIATFWSIGDLSSVAIGSDVTIGQAFLLEFMITTILLSVVLGTSVETPQGLYILAPIPIGFAVVVGVLIARTLTGASMNPARALGPAVVANSFNNHWLYWLAPLASALFVCVLYFTLFHVKNSSQNNSSATNTGTTNTGTINTGTNSIPMNSIFTN